jgi:hypothetical protein
MGITLYGISTAMLVNCDTSNPCSQAHIIDLTYNLIYMPDILISCMLGDLI